MAQNLQKIVNLNYNNHREIVSIFADSEFKYHMLHATPRT